MGGFSVRRSLNHRNFIIKAILKSVDAQPVIRMTNSSGEKRAKLQVPHEGGHLLSIQVKIW